MLRRNEPPEEKQQTKGENFKRHDTFLTHINTNASVSLTDLVGGRIVPPTASVRSVTSTCCSCSRVHSLHPSLGNTPTATNNTTVPAACVHPRCCQATVRTLMDSKLVIAKHTVKHGGGGTRAAGYNKAPQSTVFPRTGTQPKRWM